MASKRDWESYHVDSKWYFDKYPPQRSRMEEAAHFSDSLALEVGAGDGFISSLIKGQKKQVITTDISRANCKLALKRGLEPVVCDVCFLPFRDNTFFSVMGSEVLEHLPNMGKGLAEMQRVTRQRVIISLPLQNWKNEFSHLWHINITAVMHNGEKRRSEDKIDDVVIIFDKAFENWH